MTRDDPIVVLDIDGVLNGHGFDAMAQSSTIDRRCVTVFNLIMDGVPDAKIVISSAWRYMIAGGAMSLDGFGYMLRTHGVHCVEPETRLNRIIGLTCPDEELEPRGQQIRQWLNIHGGDRRHVVIDDGGENPDGSWFDMGIDAAHHPVVWTDGRRGLTARDAERAIRILRGLPLQ